MRGTSDFDKSNYPYKATTDGYTWYVQNVPENKKHCDTTGTNDERRKQAISTAEDLNKAYWAGVKAAREAGPGDVEPAKPTGAGAAAAHVSELADAVKGDYVPPAAAGGYAPSIHAKADDLTVGGGE